MPRCLIVANIVSVYFESVSYREEYVRPWIAAKVLNVVVLITRALNDLLVVHARAWPDRVDTTRLVVLVPAAAIVLPHSVFDPFLDLLSETEYLND